MFEDIDKLIKTAKNEHDINALMNINELLLTRLQNLRKEIWSTALNTPDNNIDASVKENYQFKELFEFVKSHTLIDINRSLNLLKYASCAPENGDFVECGVFKGGSAYILNTVKKNRHFYGFDTFTGHPSYNDKADYGCSEVFGTYGIEDIYPIASKFLESFQNMHLIKGMIPYVFKDIDIKISFAHIDVDLYRSTYESINWIYPRLVSKGIIICDDYGFSRYKDAAKKAIDVYMKDKPEKVILLETNQGLIIKE